MIRWISNLRANIARLATHSRDLLFPPHCAFCSVDMPGNSGGVLLCADCLKRLAPAVWHGCRRCGGEIPVRDALPQACPLCRDVRLHFDAAVALGGYHAGLRDAILRMKRPSHDTLSTAMGRLLAQLRRNQILEHQAELVVPIPMFWRRRLGRGINSPDVLARCLSKLLGAPVRHDILVRRRNTLPQAHLPPSRRFENVRGAFTVRRPEAVMGARVLLVDDVLTTGATCSEAAKMLKRAGAAVVVVAVVARAQGR